MMSNLLIISMLTSILIYYGLCAVFVGGSVKVLEKIADKEDKKGKKSSSSDSHFYEPSWDDNLGADGEPLGMPYMP